MKTKEKTHFNISQTGGDITHNRIIEANYLFLHTHNIPFIPKKYTLQQQQKSNCLKGEKENASNQRNKTNPIHSNNCEASHMQCATFAATIDRAMLLYQKQ